MNALAYDRADLRRFKLAPPKDRPNGGRVYQVVVAAPGILERHGVRERVPAEVLQAEEWLDSLAGVPVIDDDQILHGEGVTAADVEAGAVIGHVLRAWWDDVQQAVLADIVIDHPRGRSAVDAGVRGVSAAYRYDTAPDDTGAADVVHVRRWGADNLAITLTPRDGAADLRADSLAGDAIMDEKVMEMLEALGEKLDALQARLDESEGARRADDADPPEPPPEPTAADMDDAKMAADSLGVQVEPADTVSAIRAKVLEAAGHGSLAADSHAAVVGVIAQQARKAAEAAAKAEADKPKSQSVTWLAADSSGSAGSPDWSAGLPAAQKEA